MRRLALLLAIVLVVAGVGYGWASAATRTTTLQGGSSLRVSCAGAALAWAQSDGLDGTATCTPKVTTTTVASTTTSTVPASTTSTTAPATTTTTAVSEPPASTDCPPFIEAPSSGQAFCDPLATADPTAGTRSGDLNGVLWGVSRATSVDNAGQQVAYNWASSWLGATSDNKTGTGPCGANSQVVTDPGDVRICDGMLVDTTNDDEGQIALAMYPRQPFDFAGRTGTVEFDVSDNTQGIHGAWPTFVISDQPVPAPYGHASGLEDTARNSIGVDFNDLEGNSSSCLTADVWATTNYSETDEPTTHNGCVQASSGLGHFNHVELQVNSSGVQVFMSNPDQPSSLKLIATSTFQVPLTRGLVWLEDVHYNGDKFGTQQTNSLSWRNLAFDGPVLPRDLGFDVLDNHHPDDPAANGLASNDNGWGAGTNTFTWSNLSHVEDASGALLVLNLWPTSATNLTYSVNGGPAQTFAWPFARDVTGDSSNGTWVSQTIALPLPLGQLHDGTNTVTLTSSADVANLDLILQGAGGTVTP